jgi:glycosyltransferase involved in cell wall biosynthesis
MTRIVICRSNPIDPDPRVEKIARSLASAGHSVSLLGWDRTGKLPVSGSLDPSSSASEPNKIYRIPLVALFGHGMANLPNLLRWQWRLLGWLVRQHKQFDLIHACDFDTILPALACQKLFGKKVVYDIFDFYADHLRATPELLKRLIRFADLRAIESADALILADDSRWEQISGARPRRSAIIYNSPAVPTGLPPLDPAPVQARTGLRLAYIGLLQKERGLFEMLAVLQKHPTWQLDLAGFGGDEKEIQSACQALPNCRWHGRIPYHQALQLSQAADVLFATYDPQIPNHRFSSPNKVFEAMLLGKPIIVARNTNMDRMIEGAQCGIVVEYGHVLDLERTLAQLEQDPALRQTLGQNARLAYQTLYSWEEMDKRLKKLYGEVCQDQSPQYGRP